MVLMFMMFVIVIIVDVGEGEWIRNKCKIVWGNEGDNDGDGDDVGDIAPIPHTLPHSIIIPYYAPILPTIPIGDEVDASSPCRVTIHYNITHHAQCSNVFSLHVPWSQNYVNEY